MGNVYQRLLLRFVFVSVLSVNLAQDPFLVETSASFNQSEASAACINNGKCLN